MQKPSCRRLSPLKKRNQMQNSVDSLAGAESEGRQISNPLIASPESNVPKVTNQTRLRGSDPYAKLNAVESWAFFISAVSYRRLQSTYLRDVALRLTADPGQSDPLICSPAVVDARTAWNPGQNRMTGGRDVLLMKYTRTSDLQTGKLAIEWINSHLSRSPSQPTRAPNRSSLLHRLTPAVPNTAEGDFLGKHSGRICIGAARDQARAENYSGETTVKRIICRDTGAH